jgi:hypothetical protein
MIGTEPAARALTGLLGRLAADPPRHARLLNTLSLLEYIGVRKILKSRPAETFTPELLEHVVEEARHAFVLKTLALRVAPVPTYAPAHLLAGAAARAYIQALDRGAEADLQAHPPRHAAPAWLNYLYTTLLIEERADGVYRDYEPILAAAGLGGVLGGIVREEQGHLRTVLGQVRRHDPDHAARLERLRALERRAFAAFVAALVRAAGDPPGGGAA